MTLRLPTLAIAVLAGALAGTAQAQTGAVKTASLQFLTGEDGKNASTVVTITVANAGGTFLERVLDTRQDIYPDTSLSLWLNRTRPEFAAELQGSTLTLKVDAKEDDRWTVKDMRLLVTYDSGPMETWHWGPAVLEVKAGKSYSTDFAVTNDHH